jgi:hypothetical protein
MKQIKSLFIISLLSILAYSCTERIDVTLDDSYTRLVVDGAITTDTLAHTVLLSKTSSYYYNQPSPPVTGAKLSITDGDKTFELREDMPGVYRTDPNVAGIDSHTYTLNIKLSSPIGGYSDYTATSLLHPVTKLDSISLMLHSDWSKNGIWEVKCYVLEPPTVDFYRFLISRNSQLLTDSLKEWFVTDDKFLNGNYTNGIGIGYLDQGSPEEGLVQGDTITVEVNNIGKEYADFLFGAQAELFGSNPLFSGPPANVKGNINNGAIGFFAAYSATRSFAITPEFKK